ncbi:S-layer homology domain-containing protein (plasmid) [Paenibacillus sp. S-38]|uniref:S-layer homology domain-containing protein n=1 Tax=Paenibacillus sp. S-38 TaxID=3416710 RepID=UPI003CF6D4DB
MYAALLALSLTATSLPAAASAQAFTDVDRNQYAWAVPALDAMVANGVINGFEDGSFKPTKEVTKAEFASMITRLFDKYHASEKDLPGDDWAAKALRKMGTSQFLSEEFDKNNGYQMTRLEIARWIAENFDGRFDQDLPANELIQYTSGMSDVKVYVLDNSYGPEEYAKVMDEIQAKVGDNYLMGGHYILDKDAEGGISGSDMDLPMVRTIANFNKAGLMTPYNGQFRPTDKISRIETAVFLTKLATYMEKQGFLKEYSSK